VAGDTNGKIDAFVRDRQSGQTSRVSVSTVGVQSNSDSGFSSLSADGRFIAFDSEASNLVAGDTNVQNDVFFRDQLLNKSVQADLRINSTKKITAIQKNGQGSFFYTITNNGPATVSSVRIQHAFTNGQLVTLTPSQGVCKRYAIISLCNLGKLIVGASVTLRADIKALRNPVTQYLSISSNGPGPSANKQLPEYFN
jgi:hypothetical protein